MMRISFLAGYYLLNCMFVAEPFSIALTLPLFLLCCLNLYLIEEPHFVAKDMLWLIVYLFFVIGPCQAIGAGYIGKSTGPVVGIPFSDAELVETSALVFLFFSVATVIGQIAKTPAQHSRAASLTMESQDAILLLIVNVGAFMGFVLFSGGIGNVLASRAEKLRDEASAVAAVFLALQIVSTAVIAAIYRSENKSPLTVFAIAPAIILLVVSQNPFNTARYFLVAAWLPVFFVFVKGRIGSIKAYAGIFASILVLMPVLSLTSRFGLGRDALSAIDLQETFFRIPYIDVFDMLAYEIKYLEHSDYFFGQKTLGMLLFFVPRAIWTSKPTILAQDMGVELVDAKIAGTSNLSMFFAGEFYADFGMLGVVMGAALVALIILKTGIATKHLINGIEVRSFIYMAAIPILIRGPFGANAPLCCLELIFLAAISFFLGRRAPMVQKPNSLRGNTRPSRV
ncbi:hypothetical protein CVM73_08735 [Bradyrhizobium forestalis]|uniref:Oligosaccharide repeat unit polymerase n=1 Tax=Bradyrhizobium forestalis TaxID=1419263 RepID=A0A2M8RCT6_9BRAD|nr:hypothetical protein [Bradyrhizobium forestalis]PJG55632.1 hypothetical protein CVM73_08735 [Bradyrhizobium forestalis]